MMPPWLMMLFGAHFSRALRTGSDCSGLLVSLNKVTKQPVRDVDSVPSINVFRVALDEPLGLQVQLAHSRFVSKEERDMCVLDVLCNSSLHPS